MADLTGIELPLLYAGGALAIALTGPGGYSLDSLLGLSHLWTPEVVWGVIAAGIVGGIVNLGLRRPAAQGATA
jgi:hypothetical protein